MIPGWVNKVMAEERARRITYTPRQKPIERLPPISFASSQLENLYNPYKPPRNLSLASPGHGERIYSSKP